MNLDDLNKSAISEIHTRAALSKSKLLPPTQTFYAK